VVGFEGIDPKAANYKALVTKMRAVAPDLVYFGGTTQTNAGQIAKDIVAGGLSAKYLVPDGCREDAFIEAAGANTLAGRGFITFGGVPPEQMSGKGLDFLAAYRQAFSAEPQAYALYGYEAGRVVLAAIEKAGKKDRGAVVEALRTTKDFSGTLGTWSFDANGDTTLRILSVSTVENGKFKPVKVIGQ
jgi:branched-chain amino acid transport system substrate-binding protein